MKKIGKENLSFNKKSSRLYQFGVLFVAMIMVLSVVGYAVTIRWNDTTGFVDTDMNYGFLPHESNWVIYKVGDTCIGKNSTSGAILASGTNDTLVWQTVINNAAYKDKIFFLGNHTIDASIHIPTRVMISSYADRGGRLNFESGFNGPMFYWNSTYSSDAGCMCFTCMEIQGNDDNEIVFQTSNTHQFPTHLRFYKCRATEIGNKVLYIRHTDIDVYALNCEWGGNDAGSCIETSGEVHLEFCNIYSWNDAYVVNGNTNSQEIKIRDSMIHGNISCYKLYLTNNRIIGKVMAKGSSIIKGNEFRINNGYTAGDYICHLYGGESQQSIVDGNHARPTSIAYGSAHDLDGFAILINL